MKLVVNVGPAEHAVELGDAPGEQPLVDGKALPCDVVETRPGVFSVLLHGRSYEVVVHHWGRDGAGALAVDGRPLAVVVEDALRRALRAATGGPNAAASRSAAATVAAPMPGRVVSVVAGAGERVERGQTLVVLEAMKMESAIGAPHAGTVAEILVSPGQAVQQRQPLVRLAAAG